MEREERIGINGGDGEKAGNVPPLIPIRSSVDSDTFLFPWRERNVSESTVVRSTITWRERNVSESTVGYRR
jgi:hypothetical protein